MLLLADPLSIIYTIHLTRVAALCVSKTPLAHYTPDTSGTKRDSGLSGAGVSWRAPMMPGV